jgi:hypothetical protein
MRSILRREFKGLINQGVKISDASILVEYLLIGAQPSRDHHLLLIFNLPLMLNPKMIAKYRFS